MQHVGYSMARLQSVKLICGIHFAIEKIKNDVGLIAEMRVKRAAKISDFKVNSRAWKCVILMLKMVENGQKHM